MKRASNRLTIFGSPLIYGRTSNSSQLVPSLLSKSGISNDLISLGNKVKHYGVQYPKANNGDTELRVVGRYSATLAKRVYQERKSGRRIINIGGDHSVAIGSINGILLHDPDTIILWIDPHVNYPSDKYTKIPSISFLTGLEDVKQISHSKYLTPKLRFDRIAYIGSRDVGRSDNSIFEYSDSAIQHCTQWMGLDASTVIEYTINKVDPEGGKPIYVLLDFNTIDTSGSGKNGIRIDDTFNMLSYLNSTQRVIGMDIVEVDPKADIEIAKECIKSLFMSKT